MQTLKFKQRLFVETHVIHIIRPKICLSQAVFNGAFWKPLIVLVTCKPLFLRCGHDLTVNHQRRC